MNVHDIRIFGDKETWLMYVNIVKESGVSSNNLKCIMYNVQCKVQDHIETLYCAPRKTKTELTCQEDAQRREPIS
jgi:hypothetical protein